MLLKSKITKIIGANVDRITRVLVFMLLLLFNLLLNIY